MLLQIGYAKPGVVIEALDNGTVWANRGRIAGLGGWMRIESVTREVLRGAPASFAMQIRTEGPLGRPFIVVEQIEVAGSRYDDLGALALALSGDIGWIGHLAGSVHREIDVAIEIRRLQSGTREIVQTPVDTRADDTRRMRRMV